jgi:hypothetical protein
LLSEKLEVSDIEFKTIFLAKPEGGRRMVILRRPITQPKKGYLGFYSCL